MLFEILLWGFIFYLVYKFVFEFLLPIGKVALNMKQKVDKMREQQSQQQTSAKQQSTQKWAKPTIDDKDYIDFEEIK